MNNNLIGVISDTHGLLSHSAIKALYGANLIIHAGDIGDPGVLKSLQSIAPTIAVRGNMDTGDWAHKLKKTEKVNAGGLTIYVLHDLERLKINVAEVGYDVIISGHTHRPFQEKRNSVLFLNPGSAGYPRSDFSPSIALITVQNNSFSARFVELE